MAPLPRFNEVAPQPLPQYGPLPYFGQGQQLSLIGALTKEYDIKLAQAQADFTFANILQNGSSLKVIYLSRDTSAGTGIDYLQAQFSGDTAGDYNTEGNTVQTATNNPFETLNGTFGQVGTNVNGGAPAGIWGSGWFEIPNYSDTTMEKHWTGLGSSHNAAVQRFVTIGGSWKVIATPITSIRLFPAAGSFAQGCRFILQVYG